MYLSYVAGGIMFILDCSSNIDMAWQLYTTSALGSAGLAPIFPRWHWVTWGNLLFEQGASGKRPRGAASFEPSHTPSSQGITKLHQDLFFNVLLLVIRNKHLLWSTSVSVSDSSTSGKGDGACVCRLAQLWEWPSLSWKEFPSKAETLPGIT